MAELLIRGTLISEFLILQRSVKGASCGKSDKIKRFPEGTSMIKMMDEDNGRFTLGNSNVNFLLGSTLAYIQILTT